MLLLCVNLTIKNNHCRYHPPWFLRQGLSEAWDTPICPCWLASEPQESVCLSPSSTGITSLCCNSRLLCFTQVPGIWTQALVLAQQGLGQRSHLRSPDYYILFVFWLLWVIAEDGSYRYLFVICFLCFYLLCFPDRALLDYSGWWELTSLILANLLPRGSRAGITDIQRHNQPHFQLFFSFFFYVYLFVSTSKDNL